MSKRSASSTSRRITVVALIIAAVGIIVQILSGVDFPTIPPGLIILFVATALVAFGPWRWSPVAGAVVGLFLILGFFASGQIIVLLDPGRLGRFVGSWILFLSLIIAVAAGAAATIHNYRVKGA